MASESIGEDEDRRIIVERYTKGREEILGQIDEWEDPKYELYHVTDRYGFIHKEHLPDRLSQYENKLRLKEAARSSKWLKMLDHWKDHVGSEKLRKRVYKGIPNQVRGKAWCYLMGVPQIRKEQEGRYQEMLEWGLEHSTDVRQIDLDVNRTFRNNIMFRDRYNVKQQELFRILVAYSVYNSEIGYCQGMSQLAALLMMYLHDEEDVFWAMDRLMSDDRYAMHGFFIPGFPKLTRFSRHHDKVLNRFLPRVAKHFKKFDIDSTLYTLKWFFQCFLDRVPFSLTLRLWDCFMVDGEVILTGMSYTLLKLHKKTVIRKGMEELLEFLQIDLEKDFGYHDDEAINALAQSITELRKYKMHLPRDPPPDSEKPTRPFGILLQSDNVSIYTDTHSTMGSIILRPDTTSVMDNALTSSEEDVSHKIKSDAGKEHMQDSAKAVSDDQAVPLPSVRDISEEIKFIDSATNALNTPENEVGNFVIGNRDQELTTQNGISEIVKMVEDMQREQFGNETNGSTSQVERRFRNDEVILSSATSVLVALRGSAHSDSEDFMQDWPDSRPSYTLSTDHKDTQYSSETSSSSVNHTSDMHAAASKKVNGREKGITRRTSIPKLVSARHTTDIMSSTYPTSAHNKAPSFIPRVVRSPTSGESRSQHQQQVTISVGKETGLRPTGRRGSGTDPEKVRIFVPYADSSSSRQISSRVVANKSPNPLPAVDT